MLLSFSEACKEKRFRFHEMVSKDICFFGRRYVVTAGSFAKWRRDLPELPVRV